MNILALSAAMQDDSQEYLEPPAKQDDQKNTTTHYEIMALSVICSSHPLTKDTSLTTAAEYIELQMQVITEPKLISKVL